MTMVSSGPISLGGNATTSGLNQSINIELGQSATATISLNDANVRSLLGKASGTISLSDAYGKANQFAFTISSNQTNANLRTLAINAGWNQNSLVVATIASGVFISSNNTGTSALTVNGSFPGGVTLTNNGTIVGMGGAGGGGGYSGSGGPGANGGNALTVSVGVTITNNGTIAGGGGGGGGARGTIINDEGFITYQGGGGGGGRSSAAANSAGGAGGSGGGQGTVNAPGGGGASSGLGAAFGGAGGGWGAAGGTGSSATVSGNIAGTQGPWAGGSGGSAVVGNANITWLAFGTRLGAIS